MALLILFFFFFFFGRELHRYAGGLVCTQWGVQGIQVTWLSVIAVLHLSLDNLVFRMW